ncbi:MAG: mitochondrial K+-H+ exchange-related family protein [Acidobacteriota bacterium]|nr:mitochondrial K+-H+ exchange-related family protein [Acidobacteriota bacterium]
MDVYLVPVGADRYELYCEIAEEPEPEPSDTTEGNAATATTVFGRFKTRFIEPLKKRVHDTIADAEREWRERQAGRIDTPSGWWGRSKARARGWLAERVAEQRLLWHLRKQDTATLTYPADRSSDASLTLMRDSLQRDFERHRRWFVINVVGFIASGLTFLVPGPNLLAYYFFFRLAGHYLSMKGARHGLDLVVWTPEPSVPLTDLRAAAAMPPAERGDRVRAIAAALGLEHLATFFNRVAAV